MSLKGHAIKEFKAAGWLNEAGEYSDEMQKLMCEQVLQLLEVFSSHGHSGSSAPYAINLFKAVASYGPIVPLQGVDSEWNEVGEGVFQNNRCGHVFKQADRFNGQAYDIDAVVFWEWSKLEDGEPFKSYFTSSNSRQPITFPYTPEKVYKERRANGTIVEPEDESVKEMVNRFLTWPVPKDFHPDGGVSFKAPENSVFWPTGTNLLTGIQATEMFKHVMKKD